MKWEGQDQSSNVEDRRGAGGGFGGLGGRSVGIGGLVVALVAGWAFGINPLTILGMMEGGGGAAPPAAHAPPPADREAAFVSIVLRDTEVVWGRLFQAGNTAYREPRLVLFSGATPTACGTGQSAMGPFYCPGDAKVYLDLQFFGTLAQRLGAPGDFAQAYVVAHEVGHHVQNLLGISAKVESMRGRLSQTQANALSVRVELQADCFAGVWAHHSQQGKRWLDASDVDEALNAASKIGDDALQRAGRGTVVPESFTHGSSAQRVAWFRRGYDGGSVKECNTLDGRPL